MVLTALPIKVIRVLLEIKPIASYIVDNMQEQTQCLFNHHLIMGRLWKENRSLCGL